MEGEEVEGEEVEEDEKEEEGAEEGHEKVEPLSILSGLT